MYHVFVCLCIPFLKRVKAEIEKDRDRDVSVLKFIVQKCVIFDIFILIRSDLVFGCCNIYCNEIYVHILILFD